MEAVVLTQGTNTLQSEIMFHCNPVLKDVIVPESIEIDVKWFVDGENVLSEAFNAKDKVSGTLSEEHWRMGPTVRQCLVSLLCWCHLTSRLPENICCLLVEILRNKILHKSV